MSPRHSQPLPQVTYRARPIITTVPYLYLSNFVVCRFLLVLTLVPGYDSDGSGQFGISASGMSGVEVDMGGHVTNTNVVQTNPFDNGLLRYDSDNFDRDLDSTNDFADWTPALNLDSDTCVFRGSVDMTCGLVDGDTPRSCGYGVRAAYVDGRTLVLDFPYDMGSNYGTRIAAKS